MSDLRCEIHDEPLMLVASGRRACAVCLDSLVECLTHECNEANEANRICNKHHWEMVDEIERLRSAREVQDAALMNLRSDLRECAKVRDADIERLRELLQKTADDISDIATDCDIVGVVPDQLRDIARELRIETTSAVQPSDVQLLSLMTDRADWLTRKVREYEQAFAKVYRLERQLAAKGDEQNRKLALEIVNHVNAADTPKPTADRLETIVAWMTDDGRVVNAHSKATCGNSSLNTFTIPLIVYQATDQQAADQVCRCMRDDGTTRFNINCTVHGRAP